MEEKKTVKVSLGTVVCIFIIILLVIALGVMYFYYNSKDKNNNKGNNVIVEKTDISKNIIVEENDEIEELIKNYILTDFGPKNNMKNVTVNSYKEITSEEYFSNTPGGTWTEEEKTEFLNKNPNLMYGYCRFTIELKDANKLILEGSKPDYQETVGNNFKSEAIFTLNKKTNEIKFDTTYRFNTSEHVSEDTIKILVEKHMYSTTMPMSNGEIGQSGTSKFIASNGYIYEYTYNNYAYDIKTSYPKTDKLEELSKELISKAKKTENKLTDEELKKVKEYIKNVEEEKEKINEMNNHVDMSTENIAQQADINKHEDFTMYNYVLDKKIEINSEIKGKTFYESPSITKLLRIVKNYI